MSIFYNWLFKIYRCFEFWMANWLFNNDIMCLLYKKLELSSINFFRLEFARKIFVMKKITQFILFKKNPEHTKLPSIFQEFLQLCWFTLYSFLSHQDGIYVKEILKVPRRLFKELPKAMVLIFLKLILNIILIVWNSKLFNLKMTNNCK